MYSFPNFEPVHCSLSGSNCCFLICRQISQEAGKVVQYIHLFKNFPQFVVICTVKSFGVVNEAEVDVFLKLACFFDDPTDVGILISSSSAFSKSSSNIWTFSVHILLKPGLENFELYFTSMWDECNCTVVWRKKWPPTPVFLPGESQRWGSLVGCHLWGHTESDTAEVT